MKGLKLATLDPNKIVLPNGKYDGEQCAYTLKIYFGNNELEIYPTEIGVRRSFFAPVKLIIEDNIVYLDRE